MLVASAALQPDSPAPLKIPNALVETALARAIAQRIAGTPADGSAPPEQPPAKVIWVDQGDEVLVHLDAIRTRVLDRLLLVSLDLEADETGRATLVVPLALGNAADPAGLVAVTDDYPRGNGVLASRWGDTVQAAVWSSVLALANEHAAERGAAPLAIFASAGALTLQAGPRLSVAPLKRSGR
jgi:hypothetical protein